MKTANFVFYLLIATVGFSCKKPKENKVCNTSYLAWYWDLNDSLILNELNASGVSISNGLFLPVQFNPDLIYDKNDKCFYCIQSNYLTHDLFLYRFDVKNKKTDIITYSGQPFIQNRPTDWSLAYNGFKDKFYLQYYDLNKHNELDAGYEVTISGNTFTLDEFTQLRQYHFSYAPYIDELTGAMYFSTPFLIYPSNTVPPIDPALYKPVFNTNDGMMYGIGPITPDQDGLWKFDTQKGIRTLVGPIAFTGHIGYTTFDACNNQYIIQFYDSVLCIDAKNASIVKRYKTDKEYSHLTYIPK